MRSYITGSAALFAAILCMPDTEAGSAAPDASEKTTKSIVPAKYGNKYKNGGSDALAEFIKSQCTGKDGFEFTAFFKLARNNGIAEDQVAKYESAVAEKLAGAPGRARMTLRNMLATKARKDGKLIGLDDSEHAIDLPKPAVSGAAAKAQADAGTTTDSE